MYRCSAASWIPWQRKDQRLHAKYVYKELIINIVNTQKDIHMKVHIYLSLLGITPSRCGLFQDVVKGLKKAVKCGAS